MEMKMLIVDDDPYVRKVLARLGQRMGCKVAAAADGMEGLELLKKHKTDVVLLDIIMPGMTGLEFLEQAKKRRPGLKVIMVTGVQDEESAERALDLGASDYVVKPFDLLELEERVRRQLAGKRPK